jgi:transposase-like protein
MARQRRVWGSRTRAAVVAAYLTGTAPKEIMAQYGVPERTLYNWVNGFRRSKLAATLPTWRWPRWTPPSW